MMQRLTLGALAVVAALGVTLGCGPSSTPAATPAPQATITAITPAPVVTPTLTPTPAAVTSSWVVDEWEFGGIGGGSGKIAMASEADSGAALALRCSDRFGLEILFSVGEYIAIGSRAVYGAGRIEIDGDRVERFRWVEGTSGPGRTAFVRDSLDDFYYLLVGAESIVIEVTNYDGVKKWATVDVTGVPSLGALGCAR